jgi:sterol 3beta-glucosyltransferase
MKITLLCYGSRGDVQPFLALAVALQKAGHEPLLTAPAFFSGTAAKHKVPFHTLPGDPAEISLAMNDAGSNPLGMIRSVRDYVIQIAPDVIQESRAALQGADLVIHSFLFTTGGHSFAVELGIPDISVQLFPMFAPTSAFPNVATPWIPKGFPSWFSHWLATQVFWYGGNSGVRSIRKHLQPGQMPKLLWPFRRNNNRSLTPLVIACSPTVLPRPDEWDQEHVHLPGYFFLDDPDYEAPARLAKFLADGEAPICVTFGSTINRESERIREMILSMLAEKGLRAILLTGWGGETRADLPAGILAIDEVPHSWLLPKCRAVIHHGGAGTTAAGLRAGIPNIVIPSAGDQAFWSRRVAELGVGPEPIKLKHLNEERLSDAIQQVMYDPHIQEGARLLGERIRAEDGVGEMIRLVEHTLKQWK